MNENNLHLQPLYTSYYPGVKQIGLALLPRQHRLQAQAKIFVLGWTGTSAADLSLVASLCIY